LKEGEEETGSRARSEFVSLEWDNRNADLSRNQRGA
jgi:hypothetical protein